VNLFAKLQRFLPVLFLGSPDARFQPVYVVNVAQAFAECLPRLESFGATYELVGPRTYTLRELVRYVGELTGHRRPIVGLGPRLSYLQAGLLEFSPVKLLTRDNVHSMKLASVSAHRLPFGIEPMALEAVAPVWLAQRSPRSRYNLFRDRSHRAR
jgi:NADH dehydrogenase